MCGIFGAIGKNVNLDIVRLLAIYNETRGNESLGFFSRYMLVKKCGLPSCLVFSKRFSKFLKNHRSCGFIAGHTRQSTRGKVTDDNAHPFRYGKIIGAHNGVVYAPRYYTVDSEYLIDTLDVTGNISDIDGWWGLSWYDGNKFCLEASGNTIALGKRRGVYYYSSDEYHLQKAGVYPQWVLNEERVTFDLFGGMSIEDVYNNNYTNYYKDKTWKESDDLIENEAALEKIPECDKFISEEEYLREYGHWWNRENNPENTTRLLPYSQGG